MSHLRQVATSGSGPDSKLLVYDPLLLLHHNQRLANYTPQAGRFVATPVLESQHHELLTRVPSFAKVSTLGLNKKILFKHFKQGMKSSLSRERLLSRITGASAGTGGGILASEFKLDRVGSPTGDETQEKAAARKMMMEYQRQQQALQLSLHNINPFTQRAPVTSPQGALKPPSRQKAHHIKTRVPPLNMGNQVITSPPSPLSSSSARKSVQKRRAQNRLKHSSGSDLMTLRRHLGHADEEDQESELGAGHRGISGGLDGAKYISMKGIKTAAQVIKPQ